MKDQQSQKDLAATTIISNPNWVANFAINGASETIGVPFSKTLDREGVSTLDDSIWSVGGTEGTTLSILQAETLSSSGRKYAEWQIPAETGYYELLQKVSDVPLHNLQYEFGFKYKLTEPMKGLGVRLVLEFDEPKPDGERFVFLNLGEVEPSVDWKEFATNVSFPALDYERVKSVWISFQNISPSPKTCSVTQVRLGPETEKYVWRKEGEPATTCDSPLILQ